MESINQKLKRNIQNGTLIKNVSTALRNRIVKGVRTHNALYFFDKHRVLCKKYMSGINGITSNHNKIANYYIDNRVPINNSSIIYSLGILDDVSFDLELNEKFGCDVYMYDPTPSTEEFMKQYDSFSPFKYKPYGVWIKNETLKFYSPKFGGSSSLMKNIVNSDDYFEAKCFTMRSIMEENNHKNISLFKADIEGAALPIIIQMTKDKIFPDQIIVEFERPKKDDAKVKEFFTSLTKLRSDLKTEGYEEFLLPRKEAKYLSLEMLFVKRESMKS